MSHSNNPKQPKITACRDDKSIIERMKQIRIWKKMKQISRPGRTASIINGDELFIWHGTEGDSGYTYFKCDSTAQLLILVAQLLSHPILSGSNTRH